MDIPSLSILRIIYASLLAGGTTSEDMDAIIALSAERNSRDDISGILAIEDGKVCQILEGPETAVTALYKRIERDPRHSGVVLLDRRMMRERAFSEWAMTRRPMFDVVMVALHSK